jgi:hypothetical protein
MHRQTVRDDRGPCPLYPQVLKSVLPVLDDKEEGELVSEQLSFEQWLTHNEVRLLHINARMANGHLRKFAEQHGDIIQWDQSNRVYILTNGVSGVEWRHYRNPLPKNVYEVYTQYWKNVDLSIS